MKILKNIQDKKEKLAIGLMSGTSVDGVDAVLVKIEEKNKGLSVKEIYLHEKPFPPGLKKVILDNSVKETSDVETICRLNFLIANIYADAVNELLEKNNLTAVDIDFIGTHGQTIQHLPVKEDWFGYEIASTLQIGDPSVLAKLAGITVVGDFRVGDIALGGQGAPLVPLFDYLVLASENKNRILLNIGGISNFTALPAGCGVQDVRAFDAGPGNMIIDYLMKKFFNEEFDSDGEKGFAGKINEKLLNALIEADEFIERDPPKSTGREYYGEKFLTKALKNFSDLSKEDWIATVEDFTAYAVFRNYEKFILPKMKADEIFASGGGAKNKFMMKRLADRIGLEIKDPAELGIAVDSKEASCFAVLAHETLCERPGNVPSVTGASSDTILGKICLP